MDQPAASPKKILVVEDEEYLRDLYVEILTKEGYTIEQASDGQEGLELMRKGGYDLVLLDIMLPKLDGFQILEKLQLEPPSSPNKAVLILTNLGKEVNVARGISLGARGYLTKTDTTPDQVIKEVKSYLEGSN
jgi:DNA-binding response OmpR family regulator